MNERIRGSSILVKTSGNQSEVVIDGTKTEILFNWTALTNQICKTIGILPIILAAMLPQMLSDYQHNALKYEVRIGGKAGAGR